MQAQPLSTTAARNPTPAALPYLTTHESGFPDVSPVAAAFPLTGGTSVAGSIGLAHDAGNLLGALRLYADLLGLPGVLRPEHKHYATELGLLSERSSVLITRLLEPVGPVDRGVCQAASEDLATVLRGVAPLLEQIAARSARVVIEAPMALPVSNLKDDIPSAETLERLLTNLVSNAAEAIASGAIPAGSGRRGTIWVRLGMVGEAGERCLRLSVEDDGPGLSPGMAAAFLRPTPLRAGETRGLGHRIVNELARSTGAGLSLRTGPGRGTTVTLEWRLPTGSGGASRLRPRLGGAGVAVRGLLGDGAGSSC